MLLLAMMLPVVVCCCIPITAAFLLRPSSNIIQHRRHRNAFHVPHDLSQHQQTALLSSTKSHPTEHDWSINAIEEARQQFEHLIGPMIFDDSDSTNGKSIGSVDKKKPHLLTNAGRKRREIEIRLLKSLQYNDDAIDELMSLWIHECPNQIVNIDLIQFMSSQDSSCTVKEAEMILRNVINDCPISVWSEPGARLAYILFLQEQYKECEQCVESVLLVKPWHFEMIQLQILLELTYHHNMSRAIHIARHYGLPPLHHIKQRSRWVKHATEQAQHQLQELELYTESELHCGQIEENDRRDHQCVHQSNSTSSSSSLTAAAISAISSWE